MSISIGIAHHIVLSLKIPVLFRECLYLTLDRLKNEPSGHALNANIGDMVEELENLIHESEGAEVGSNNGNGGVTVNNR